MKIINENINDILKKLKIKSQYKNILIKYSKLNLVYIDFIIKLWYNNKKDNKFPNKNIKS